jgi:ABC-type multidrug transport system fused ATPase/permease subunit
MIASFTVTLIECLEIALITLLLTKISASVRLYIYGIIGLVLGYFASVALYELVEDYEWVGYGILSLMLFYLFFRGKNMAAHVKEHIEEIQSVTKELVIFVTVVTVYGRESFEIFAQLLLNETASWSAAGAAVIVAIVAFFIGQRNKKINGFIFTWGHWVYLGLALWFGYECIEHLHII